jgi:hypothetical protein
MGITIGQIMQDNWTDEQFMDFAWEQMRQTLDVEMPQEKKRRLLIWWWLSGMALGMALMFFSASNRPHLVKTEQIPLAKNTYPLQKRSESQTSNKQVSPANSKSTTSVATNQVLKTPESVINSSQRKTSQPATSLIRSSSSNNIPKTNSSTEVLHSVEIPSNTTLKLAKISLPAENKLIDNQSFSPKNTPLTDTLQDTKPQNLTLPILTELLQQLISSDSIRPLDVQVKRKPDFRPKLWLDAGMLYGYPSNGVGGQISLLSGKSFGKWTLMTGLGYQTAGLNLQLQSTAQKTFDPVMPSLGVSAGKDSSQAEQKNTYANASIRLQSLFLPIIIQRNLGKRWQLEGGALLQRHFSYQRTTDLPLLPATPITNSGSKSSDNNQSFSNFSGTKGSNLSPDLTLKMSIAVQFGATYWLSPRLRVHLAVQSTFTDLIKSDVYKLRPQYLQLGLRYQIK